MPAPNQQTSITEFLSSPFNVAKLKPLMTSTPINSNSNQQSSITNFLESPFEVNMLKPLMTSTPVNPTATICRKRRLPENDENQMILDLGQKLIGMTNCKECGMVYSADDGKDRNAHDNFHNRFTNTKFFKVETRSLNSWKKNFYNEVHAGKISGIIFKCDEKKKSSLKTKLENVIKDIVDVQLGICDDVPIFDKSSNSLGFVFVADAVNKQPPYIGAVVMTEKAQLVKLMPTKMVYKGIEDGVGYIAVERLWVHPSLRRQGIASHLLDVILRLYSPKIRLMRSRIAFVDPNPTGVEFAKAYLNNKGKWIQIDGDEDSFAPEIKKIKVKVENINVEKKLEPCKLEF